MTSHLLSSSKALRQLTGACAAVACACALLADAGAAVVRPAPDFTFPAAGNRSQSLRSLKGQPVVLVIADSPQTGAFRAQLKALRSSFSPFASRQVIFAAAFRNGEGPVKSDIPFTVVNNGAAVASAYGVKDDFCVVIIGKDGNIDYQTPKVCTAARIREVIQNSFEVQAAGRKSPAGP